MTCNCAENNNVIQFIKGTSVNVSFTFDEDISSYTYANFGIAKNYGETPIINKEVSLGDHEVNITLTPEETDDFNEFLNGKTTAQYLWWLDIIDSERNLRVNVFPQTGTHAPLCIVQKHV